ncbi:hypothetical protein [Dyadobacter sandarakinus]|uniref:Uncharacterized protein n=1 Tax=Dyadobacter sandarakinus TaxID=2747268 RepID=A0ABX7IDY2_9BACT|nr:hypothetical protein [Dyadobacter sandarakinus]QRR03318.1 hypothetical protein HWI92_21560 [Dyadobacter sandarakinus]
MKKFTSVTEAFKWWLTEMYPNLPPDVKKGKLTTAWRDFTYNQGISEKRMKSILEEFGKIEVKTEVLFTPD